MHDNLGYFWLEVGFQHIVGKLLSKAFFLCIWGFPPSRHCLLSITHRLSVRLRICVFVFLSVCQCKFGLFVLMSDCLIVCVCLCVFLCSDCLFIFSKLHTDSTSAAPHKTQGKRKADRWKIDCERRKEGRAQERRREEQK